MGNQNRPVLAGCPARSGSAAATLAPDNVAVSVAMSNDVPAGLRVRLDLELVNERAAHGPVELVLAEVRRVDGATGPGDRLWLCGIRTATRGVYLCLHLRLNNRGRLAVEAERAWRRAATEEVVSAVLTMAVALRDIDSFAHVGLLTCCRFAVTSAGGCKLVRDAHLSIHS